MDRKTYFDPENLKKFPNIGEFQKEYADKFFDYYGKVFSEGALSSKEKALVALGVAHAVQCPYCIDAYTTKCLEAGYTEEQMMEAVHAAGAIKGGATLVNSVQMMEDVKKMSM
jgi:alkylhydroperoxidase/carboxymuconolactone decarboxylase family protein